MGIDRRMAYAKRKYHSGWIWTGVTRELAGIKFSGSPKSHGVCIEIMINNVKKMINPKASLKVKYGWKGVLSKLLFNPKGLEEPVAWRNKRWIIENAAIKNGNKKWKVKNRVKVALLTANPPHNQSTISFPIRGIADAKFVITVAPQKDIWPQGKTYPRKAVPIVKKRRTTPTVQVIWKLYDP